MTPHSVRLEVAMNYIRPAEEIALRTNVPAVRQAWLHFSTYGLMGATFDSAEEEVSIGILGEMTKGAERSPHPIYLLPIFAEDCAMGGLVARMWQHCESAMLGFLGRSNIIYFRSDRVETEFQRGTALLHEVGHAERSFREGRTKDMPASTTSQILEEEVDMHTRDHLLWQERLPITYNAALREGWRYILRRFGENGTDKRFINFPSLGPWTPLLDQVGGKAPDEKSRSGRSLRFAINVHFVYGDATITDNNECLEYKKGIMQDMYDSFGMQIGGRL